MPTTLQQHLDVLRACRLCPGMQSSPVTGQAVYSRVMLVGQAPGDKEPIMQKPFAWTAGKTFSDDRYKRSAGSTKKPCVQASI